MAMKTDRLKNFLPLSPRYEWFMFVCVLGARQHYPAVPTAFIIGNCSSGEGGTAFREQRQMIFQLFLYIYISLSVIAVINQRARADNIFADGCC